MNTLATLLAPHPSPSIAPAPASTSSPIPPSLIPGGPGLTLERLQSWLPMLKLAGIGLLVALVAVVVLALVLRWKAPRVYWWTFGYPLLVWRMRRTWTRLVLNAGLAGKDLPTVTSRGRTAPLPVMPTLCRLRPRRNGAAGVIVMQPGQTPNQYTEAATAMAHAWGVHAVRLVSDGTGRGRLTMTVLSRDPLFIGTSAERDAEYYRQFPKIESTIFPYWQDLNAPVGVREDGEEWTLDLYRFPHWLITGATQSGKSTLINTAIWAWANHPIALVGIDCKGGMEFGPHRIRFTALATSKTEAADLLAKLVTETQQRMELCRQHDARNIWQLPGELRPVPIIVVVDEIAELYLSASREDKDVTHRATTNLLRLAQLGAALGVHLIIAGQRVGSDLGPGVTALRAQLAGRICLKVNDAETADMTLGDLYPDAVQAAQAIGAHERGVAITTDTHTGWIRTRSKPLTPEVFRGAMNYLAKYKPDLDLT